MKTKLPVLEQEALSCAAWLASRSDGPDSLPDKLAAVRLMVALVSSNSDAVRRHVRYSPEFLLYAMRTASWLEGEHRATITAVRDEVWERNRSQYGDD